MPFHFFFKVRYSLFYSYSIIFIIMVNISDSFKFQIKKAQPLKVGLLKNKSRGVLLSHTVAHVVPSALEGLTSVFGMGTGVAPPVLPREGVKLFTSHIPLFTKEGGRGGVTIEYREEP